MSDQERIDKLLVTLGLVESRRRAQTLIDEGLVLYKKNNKWTKVNKASERFLVSDGSIEWQVGASNLHRYVSRAGLKLEGALKDFNVKPGSKLILDVGISTGGFTDCLLTNGTGEVLGIDVGTDQLHSSLRDHPRLTFWDNINAKLSLPTDKLNSFFSNKLEKQFELIVVDVSFISQRKILPNVVAFLKPSGELLSLFKPQFESEPGAKNSRGIVVDEVLRIELVSDFCKFLAKLDFTVLGYKPAQLTGDDGNQEYFVYAKKNS